MEMESGWSDLTTRIRLSIINDDVSMINPNLGFSVNHFLYHYPGVNNMICENCNEKYNLERIWELTGCDCDSEAGTITCSCGNTMNFILNLNYAENKELFISSLLSKKPELLTEFHTFKDILGEVRLTIDHEQGVLLTFMDKLTRRKLKEIETPTECVVCYETTYNTTYCNHTLCNRCHAKLDTCPYCRRDLNTADMIVLYESVS